MAPREGDIVETPVKDIDDAIAEAAATSGPMKTIDDLEKVVFSMLNTIPKLNRRALRVEMEDMIVDLKQNPTTKDLHEGLALSQGYKDRLSEIYTNAMREFRLRNRCLDMLFDAMNLISVQKSADKRKGEATMRWPMLVIQLEAAESFLKEVEHVLQNIKSSHESVSRQISLMQIQLQLGEIRREMKAAGPQSDAEEVVTKGGNKELDWNNF
jgi:hypothetical protein